MKGHENGREEKKLSCLSLNMYRPARAALKNREGSGPVVLTSWNMSKWTQEVRRLGPSALAVAGWLTQAG